MVLIINQHVHLWNITNKNWPIVMLEENWLDSEFMAKLKNFQRLMELYYYRCLLCTLFYFLIIFYWLCYYSCSDFSPFATSPPGTPYSLRQFPYHCSCPGVMHISSLATPFPVLYFTAPWLFCTYLFVLLNLTSSPIPTHTPHLIWQSSKHPLF